MIVIGPERCEVPTAIGLDLHGCVGPHRNVEQDEERQDDEDAKGLQDDMHGGPFATPAGKKEPANDDQDDDVNRGKSGGNIRLGPQKPHHDAARNGDQDDAGKRVEQAGGEALIGSLLARSCWHSAEDITRATDLVKN